ncbi:MAG: protein translocase subunit SecF [Azoarcus sp.]|jgi:preprotein translocase subunit SecF|nr:protein translocase subunit SecF [Azoarcus sp.]
MEFFRIKKDIPFMRYALVFNVISLLTFVVAVFFLASRGLNFSLEFTGGTSIEVKYDETVSLDPIRQALANDGYPDAQVQHYGNTREVLIRLQNRDDVDSSKVGDQVKETLKRIKGPKADVQQVDYFGPQIGKELASDGAMALLVAVLGIMLYLALRFEWRFGASTVIANLHDVVIILGFFAFFQWEFSLSVLAAVLAVMGYSVNEAVIVFDRVRETFRKRRDLKTPEVINHSITSIISRTVITHGSTQMMVLSMLFFGGENLHYFALALTIGICFGIYSSVFVASPLAMWLGVSREQFARVKPQKQEAVV